MRREITLFSLQLASGRPRLDDRTRITPMIVLDRIYYSIQNIVILYFNVCVYDNEMNVPVSDTVKTVSLKKYLIISISYYLPYVYG